MNNNSNRASNADSQESTTNIGIASGDDNRIESGGSSANHGFNKRAFEPLDCAHYDPKRRAIYLGLLGLSVSSAAVGFLLLLVWMFKYRAVTGIGLSEAGQLANLHPLLMYLFMVSLNMYAVLLYRTHYTRSKGSLKFAHAAISGINVVLSLLGVFAMYKAHLMMGIPNFYSLHSWIGSLTNIFYISQFIFGFVAFLKPGLAKHRRASLMPWHRVAGAAILVLAAAAAVTGMAELVIFQDKAGAYSSFTPITFIANFAAMSVLLTTALSIYLLRAPEYLRPNQPEEEPLKRRS